MENFGRIRPVRIKGVICNGNKEEGKKGTGKKEL